MSDSKTTHFTNPSSFILLGIPGLEAGHVWNSIPFCAMCVIAILGNCGILLIVRMERSFHAPMYYFLCMLAVIDLVLSTSVLPKMLSIFWFNFREIDFVAGLTQLCFISSFLSMESGILVALAFDRYVAICEPLSHSTILTDSVVAMIGLAVLLRGGLLVLPYPILARWRPYCRTNIINHTSYERMAVVKLACSEISTSSYYGLSVLLLVNVADVIFLTLSYIQILRAIFSLRTKEARVKTFGTYSAHICVILAFFIPAIFTSLSHRYGHSVSLHFHNITINLCLMVPPMLNPIIYGLRTKQIRDRLLQFFIHKSN